MPAVCSVAASKVVSSKLLLLLAMWLVLNESCDTRSANAFVKYLHHTACLQQYTAQKDDVLQVLITVTGADSGIAMLHVTCWHQQPHQQTDALSDMAYSTQS